MIYGLTPNPRHQQFEVQDIVVETAFVLVLQHKRGPDAIDLREGTSHSATHPSASWAPDHQDGEKLAAREFGFAVKPAWARALACCCVRERLAPCFGSAMRIRVMGDKVVGCGGSQPPLPNYRLSLPLLDPRVFPMEAAGQCRSLSSTRHEVHSGRADLSDTGWRHRLITGAAIGPAFATWLAGEVYKDRAG